MTRTIVNIKTGKVTVDANFVAPDLTQTPTIDDVKAEASRRILAIVPMTAQNNLQARAITLLHKGEANWTVDELAEWTAGEAIWAQVVAIRTASNVIEALDPIPADYTDDMHWP